MWWPTSKSLLPGFVLNPFLPPLPLFLLDPFRRDDALEEWRADVDVDVDVLADDCVPGCSNDDRFGSEGNMGATEKLHGTKMF